MAPRRATRLHVAAGLAAGAAVTLAPDQAHRLHHVLRLGPGAPVHAFNATDGEWLCAIAGGGAHLAVQQRVRAPEPTENEGPWLLFAPIRRVRLDWLVEKATELGAAALVPVLTARTQGERLSPARIEALALAAAEQSERLGPPAIHPAARLDRVLAAWPTERRLVLCDESGAGMPAAAALSGLPPGPAALLIGPEGGFTETELDALGKLTFVTRIGLGPRVLRAETAALAALVLFQAIAGDWHRTRPG